MFSYIKTFKSKKFFNLHLYHDENDYLNVMNYRHLVYDFLLHMRIKAVEKKFDILECGNQLIINQIN